MLTVYRADYQVVKCLLQSAETDKQDDFSSALTSSQNYDENGAPHFFMFSRYFDENKEVYVFDVFLVEPVNTERVADFVNKKDAYNYVFAMDSRTISDSDTEPRKIYFTE